MVEARVGGQLEPEWVAQMQAASRGGRLAVGAGAAVPPELAQVEYRCDREGLTGFAGLPALMQLGYGLGLADWVAELPLLRRQDTVYRPGKLCEVVVAILAAGLERVSHIDDVKHDPGLGLSVGLQQLPDQATLSRFFGDATPAAEAHLREVNRRFSQWALSGLPSLPRLVVDCDTRTVALYGKQEGTVRSRRSDGRPMYTFEISAVRNTHEILEGGLLEGATHPAPLFVDRFGQWVRQVGGQTRELIVCADAAWYADHILERIETADAAPEVPCACKYAIRAQLKPTLRRRISRLPESAWERYDEQLEVAEVSFAFVQTRRATGKRTAGHVTRRYLATRKRLPERDPSQAQLFPEPRYEYYALVTSLTWNAKRVVKLFNGRATIESILKESSLGFHMDSLPSARFSGNGVFCQLLILTYNLVNLLRRYGLPADDAKHHAPTLRRRFLAIAGWVQTTPTRTVIHVAPHGPHVAWLAHLQPAFARGLAPPATAR
jgi:hypothetical protein